MARPLLPPRGVHVPARMIYHPQLPPAVIHTWIQLRGLAWGGTVTPPLRMQELTALTGKGQTTLYSHMSQLRHMLALSWRSTEQGKIMVTFAKEPKEEGTDGPAPKKRPDPRLPDLRIPDSGNRESGKRLSLSLNPLNDSDHSLSQERDKELDIKDQGIKKEVFKREGDFKFRESEINSENPESSELVAIFRSLTHLTPNGLQREQIGRQVTEPDLWRETVSHWLTHGWNPKNVAGMLDLYARGGAFACVGCLDPQKFKRRAISKQEDTRAVLEELRREMGTVPGQENR